MRLTHRLNSVRRVFFILTLFAFFTFQHSFAATFTSVASGNWNADATWSGTGIPGAGDAVVIEDGRTVTVNISNAACSALDIGSGGLFAGAGTLAFAAASQLTVGGVMTIGSLFNAGTVDMTNGGTFISGSWSVGFIGAGHFTYGTGTVKFTNTFSLPWDSNFESFYNLEIVSNTTSLGIATTVYGNCTMSGSGVLNSNGNDLTVKGNWTQSGTGSFTEGTRTVTLNGTSDQYITHTGTETFASLVVNKASGSLILSSGSVSISTLMTISGGTVDLGTNTLSGAGGLTMSNGDLQIGQLSSVCSCTLPRLAGTYTISGGTFTFKGAGAQTIRGETVSVPIVANYNDVIFKGSGTKTLEGNLDINGSLTIQESAELDASASNRTIFLAGNWNNTSTFATPDAFNERSGNVTFDGAGAVTLTSTPIVTGETFYDLTITKSAGTDNLTLNNEIIITHQLTLTLGHIITSPVSKNLTIDANAIAVGGGNDNSFIDGPIIKKTASTTAYVLPTGKISPNNEYRWIEITPAGNTATTYVAEYFYSIPSNNTDVGLGVNRVSELEKWILQRTSGSEDAKVELSWTVNSVVNTNTTDVLVVQDDGTPGPRWINKCSCTTAGTTTTGSIQTTGTITLFGSTYPLSLGSPHATNNELGSSRYSVADGNWNNTAVWATRSGGPAGATAPTSTKRVIIEAGKRVDVNVAATALKLTLGNNGDGVLDFNATTNSLVVGGEGIVINSNSDVEGTNAASILRTTGDIMLNADVSVESADGTTASNWVLLRETSGGKTLTGTGTVSNFTNNASTTLVGNLTVKQAFSGSTAIINGGNIALKGTVAQIGANMVDATSITPNTIEYNNAVVNFDFSLKGSTYYNLILSGASVKRPSVIWTVNGTLTLNAGVTLDQDTNDDDIVVKGNWVNLGATFIPSVSAATEVTFSGTAQQSITSGGSAFGNLIINNSSSTGVVLQDDMSIGNGRKLTLTDGYVFLGNNTLLLKSTNVNIGTPSSGSFIVTNGTGALAMEAMTGSRTFPVGSQGGTMEYTPVIVDNTGGTSDRYDVKVCDNVYNDGNCSGGTQITSKTINKTWNISESVAGGSSVDLTLQWNASHELSGFDRNSTFISHYTGGRWLQEQVVGAASGSGPYTRTVTNLSGSFSPFGVGAAGSPLPIELLQFSAVPSGDSVLVTWTTASEKNNDRFEVERTADGVSYTTVATVKGAGNSDGLRRYSTLDSKPLPGTTYYRLKQTDFDGTYSFSGLEEVNYKNNKTETVFILYPNPARDMAHLTIYNVNKGENMMISVYDISGKIVYSKTVVMEKESGNQVDIDFLENIKSGMYLMTANSGNHSYKQKLIIQTPTN